MSKYKGKDNSRDNDKAKPKAVFPIHIKYWKHCPRRGAERPYIDAILSSNHSVLCLSQFFRYSTSSA